MSFEPKTEAVSKPVEQEEGPPSRSSRSAAPTGGGFGLRTLSEEVVPLETGDELDRERAERVAIVLGRRRGLRARIPIPSRAVPVGGFLAVGGVAATTALVLAIALASGGGNRPAAHDSLSAHPRTTSLPLAARTAQRVRHSRPAVARTRRRPPLTAKQQGARRRARASSDRNQKRRDGRATQGVPAPVVATPESTYEPVEAPAEEAPAYEPATAEATSPTSSEEAAENEFDFEKQKP